MAQSTTTATQNSQLPIEKQRFDLQIVIINAQQSFGLARVKQRTTIFEIKQAIEKLKQLRVEMQSLRLPEYLQSRLSENIQQMDNIDDLIKQKSLETALRIEDQRTMQSYQIFKLMPDPASGIRVPFLYLELSRQPVLLTISPLSSMQSQLQAKERNEERMQQVALSRAAQENGPTENNRSNGMKGHGNADVGGSQTDPHAEDVELEVFSTTTIYCLKFLLWRKLQVPIQNLSLALSSQSDIELANWHELKGIADLEGKDEKPQRQQTIQQFLQLPQYEVINLDMLLSVVASLQSGASQSRNDARRMTDQRQYQSQQLGSGVQVDQSRGRTFSQKQQMQSMERPATHTELRHMGSPSTTGGQSQVPPLNLNSQLGNKMYEQKTFKSLNSVNMSTSIIASSSGKKELGIDFTFNTIKDVKKVSWKDSAPWYREIYDGFCWLAYCQNETLQRDMYFKSEMRARFGPNGTAKMDMDDFQVSNHGELHSSYPARCPAYKQLVVINRGYDIFQMKKEMTNGILRCPCCRTSKFLVVKNCGFVNCEWSMRGVLRQNKDSKIYADGRTYDGKLYTFKECDYGSVWHQLDIMAKKLDQNSVQNVPYPTSNDFRKREMRLAQKAQLKKQLSEQLDNGGDHSKRSKVRSQERQTGNNNLMDSDSDSDDMMDLAVLQKQADLMLNPANNAAFSIGQMVNPRNEDDRLIQTEQFKPGVLSGHMKPSPKNGRKKMPKDAASAAILERRESQFAGGPNNNYSDDDQQNCAIF